VPRIIILKPPRRQSVLASANADDEHGSTAAASPEATAQDHHKSTGFTIRMNSCTPTTGMTRETTHE
jgi:hypothetical protein